MPRVSVVLIACSLRGHLFLDKSEECLWHERNVSSNYQLRRDLYGKGCWVVCIHCIPPLSISFAGVGERFVVEKRTGVFPWPWRQPQYRHVTSRSLSILVSDMNAKVRYAWDSSSTIKRREGQLTHAQKCRYRFVYRCTFRSYTLGSLSRTSIEFRLLSYDSLLYLCVVCQKKLPFMLCKELICNVKGTQSN